MSALPAASGGGAILRSAVPVERGATIHGGQWAPFEKVSEKVSEMGLNTLMLNGDIINFFKFLSPVAQWNASVCVPGFDLFNGVSGTICGVAITSVGVKARRMAKETEDTHGKTEANWTIEIGVMYIALSIFKLGYAILGIINFIKPLAAQVFVLIETFGILNGITTILTFVGFAVRAGYREREVHRFRDSYREALYEALIELQVDARELPMKGTPEELFKKALELSGVKEEVFSRIVLKKLRKRIRTGEDGAETKAEMREAVRELLNTEALSGNREVEYGQYDWMLEKEPLVMFDNVELLFTRLREMNKGDVRQYDDLTTKINRVHALRTQWNLKVNFENQIERATKGDIVKEIRLGHPIDDKKPQTAKAAMDHLFAKWTSRRNWNRALGIVAVVASGLVVFLMAATPGPMAMLACGLVVGLFVVFAAFFDGRGVIGALKAKKPGKWDGLIFLTQTLLLMAITTGLIIATVMTGGAPMLVYCIVVSSPLMLTQMIALGWIAKRIAQQRKALKEKRRKAFAARVEADRKPPRPGLALTEVGSEWKSCKDLTVEDLAELENDGLDEELENDGLDEEGFEADPEAFLGGVSGAVNAWLADLGDDFGLEPSEMESPRVL